VSVLTNAALLEVELGGFRVKVVDVELPLTDAVITAV
jgi:hypothetical protein